MRPRLKSRHSNRPTTTISKKNGNGPWSPGVIVGAVWLMVIMAITGSLVQPWKIVVAIIIFIVVNGLLGFEPRRVPKVKATTDYQQEDEPPRMAE